MQPSPTAETSGPRVPSLRFCIALQYRSSRADHRTRVAPLAPRLKTLRPWTTLRDQRHTVRCVVGRNHCWSTRGPMIPLADRRTSSKRRRPWICYLVRVKPTAFRSWSGYGHAVLASSQTRFLPRAPSPHRPIRGPLGHPYASNYAPGTNPAGGASVFGRDFTTQFRLAVIRTRPNRSTSRACARSAAGSHASHVSSGRSRFGSGRSSSRRCTGGAASNHTCVITTSRADDRFVTFTK